MIRIGLSRPGLVGLILLVLTVVFLALTATSIRFEGDVARALKGESDAFRAHQDLEERFRTPSKDEVLVIKADDLGDPKVFSALDDFILSLQLTDGVTGVVSVFNLPDPDSDALSYLSRVDVSDLPPDQQLDGLYQSSPLAKYLLSENRNATLINILPDLTVPPEQRVAALTEEIKSADPRLKVATVGLAALQREISAGLAKDQVFITPIATLLCIGIALLLFRSWRAATLCAVPSLLALGWTFGVMGVLGVPFDPFMSIVPPLVLVLGIADSVHVFHAVLHHAKTKDSPAAISRGLQETMPAVILAAVTTALAFSCLFFTGSPTLAKVAIIGPIAMALTTAFVYLALPPAILLIFGSDLTGRARPLGFRSLSNAAVSLLKWYKPVSAASLVMLAALVFASTQTVTGYRLMDHIPRNGDFREALSDLRIELPGSDQSFVILQAVDPSPGVSEADRQLIERAGAALYGSGKGIVPNRDGPESDDPIMRRFEAEDGRAFALPLVTPLERSGADILAHAEATKETLSEAGITNAAVTGYSLMTSIELPIVVTELRFAFYVAVGLVTLLAAVLLGSLKMALLSLIPNLAPILGVEAWLVLADRPLTITGAIALTIAFGIAVDDTIHLLNRIRLTKRSNLGFNRETVKSALRMTAAPIMTTSLVLIAGFAVTGFSILPSIAILGQLTAAAIALAVIADLFLFPSLLCWAGHRKDNV